MVKYKEKEPVVPSDVVRVAKKYGIEIPYEGLEPGETPETAQPDVIEYAGVHWATTTADAWCKSFFGGGKDYEKCIVKLLPILLEKRNVWEKNTWRGIKEFLEKFEEVKEEVEE